MQGFFVNVMIAVLTNPKVEAMLKRLIGGAVDGVKGDLLARVDELEKKVLDELAALPTKLLGSAEKDVGTLLHEITGTKEDIAGAVKGEVQPLFQPLVDVLKNLPGGGILGSIFGR